MARIKNASFVGAPPRTVTTDASITNTWLKNAVGDTALVSDKATGENSETPITHTGGGDGCPLRLPLAAQHIDKSLVIEGSTISEDDFYVVAVPVFVPAGEGGEYRLLVQTTPPIRDVVTAEVMSSAGSIDYGPFPGVPNIDEGVISAGQRRVDDEFKWSLTLGEGISYILVKRPLYFGDAQPDARLVSWTLDHDRTYAGDSNGLTVGNGGTAITDPYKAHSTFTPSTDHDTFDEEVFEDGPLSAYVLTRLNRQLNTLWEYITGAKLAGNASYQCSTTLDNNRASFTAEGRLDFPMAIAAIGACHGDTGKPAVGSYTTLTPTDGPLDWLLHPVARTMTNINFCSLVMQMPSFSTSSSALKCVVLMHSPSGAGNAANWRFRVSNATTGTSSSAVAATQIGSTNFLAATITSIPFAASSTNILNVQIANTANGALSGETLDLLGVVVYFDP